MFPWKLEWLLTTNWPHSHPLHSVSNLPCLLLYCLLANLISLPTVGKLDYYFYYQKMNKDIYSYMLRNRFLLALTSHAS